MGLGTLFLLLGLWAFLFIGCGKLNGRGEVAVNWLDYGEENCCEDKSDGDGKLGGGNVELWQPKGDGT